MKSFCKIIDIWTKKKKVRVVWTRWTTLPLPLHALIPHRLLSRITFFNFHMLEENIATLIFRKVSTFDLMKINEYRTAWACSKCHTCMKFPLETIETLSLSIQSFASTGLFSTAEIFDFDSIKIKNENINFSVGSYLYSGFIFIFLLYFSVFCSFHSFSCIMLVPNTFFNLLRFQNEKSPYFGFPPYFCNIFFILIW